MSWAGTRSDRLVWSPARLTHIERRLGAQSVTARASNTFVLKPEIDVWYDLNKDFGLNVNAGYMIARPDVIVDTTTGRTSGRPAPINSSSRSASSIPSSN